MLPDLCSMEASTGQSASFAVSPTFLWVLFYYLDPCNILQKCHQFSLFIYQCISPHKTFHTQLSSRTYFQTKHVKTL